MESSNSTERSLERQQLIEVIKDPIIRLGKRYCRSCSDGKL
ncbi:MAG TPA: hypothetical protein VJ697_07290 [Nitrososphaeraceae archaeon]|nr:hypothetical protein [Nitrososphaeraceae archaeon]